MSTFAVRVQRLIIETHPNADALELARVGDYRAVVGKGQFRTGDLAAYIPEASLLPEGLIAELGLTGRLSGPDHNRVSAVRLRGVLSQGLCVAARPGWSEGQDVAAELGVVKFEPEIPAELLGAVYVLEPDEALKFDLENIKAFPGVFEAGEPVVFTEKIHGVFMMAVGLPARLARPVDGAFPGGRFAVTSKGLMHQRLAFQFIEGQPGNVYVRTALAHDLPARLAALADRHDAPVFLLGEVAGVGVQDLAYGTAAGQPLFRVFTVAIGKTFLDDAPLDAFLADAGFDRVPVVYRGPFSAETLAAHTNGKESVSGQALHLREGVVVTPAIERDTMLLGRVALKSVSEAYLLRKGGTEYT